MDMGYKSEGAVKVIGGMGLCDGLFLLFLGLKIGGVIDWSWWWITAPLWGQVALALVGAVILIVVFIVMIVIKAISKSRK